mmetsp:Transcript_20189/g.48508  ORF Transcript_20189/g.48508 Transcript_20189/m.48508 type:complete len:168 (+) Transcript_20189:83-586(+)
MILPIPSSHAMMAMAIIPTVLFLVSEKSTAFTTPEHSRRLDIIVSQNRRRPTYRHDPAIDIERSINDTMTPSRRRRRRQRNANAKKNSIRQNHNNGGHREIAHILHIGSHPIIATKKAQPPPQGGARRGKDDDIVPLLISSASPVHLGKGDGEDDEKPPDNAAATSP